MKNISVEMWRALPAFNGPDTSISPKRRAAHAQPHPTASLARTRRIIGFARQVRTSPAEREILSAFLSSPPSICSSHAQIPLEAAVVCELALRSRGSLPAAELENTADEMSDGGDDDHHTNSMPAHHEPTVRPTPIPHASRASTQPSRVKGLAQSPVIPAIASPPPCDENERGR